ncbi:MAG TPA: TolC family protein, partial [Methylocystis sp.]|nr:TolC family protein [Methylocystis sp.]
MKQALTWTALTGTALRWTSAGGCRARLGAPVWASLFALSVGGCAVGPDFVSPEPPPVDRYTPEPAPKISGQQLVVAQEIPKRWWEVFHNKNLNRLVEASIEHNPGLQAANAGVRMAYYNAEAQKGGFLPTVLFDSNDSTNLQSGVQQV